MKRALVAFDSRTAMLLEINAQGLAEQVLRLNKATKASSARVSLSLNFKLRTVKATLSTREDWCQEILHRPEGGVMGAEMFGRWISGYTKTFTDNYTWDVYERSKEVENWDLWSLSV